MVKAFVVLSIPFKSSNLEKLTLELQDHVKKSTAPYKYPRKVRISPIVYVTKLAFMLIRGDFKMFTEIWH